MPTPQPGMIEDGHQFMGGDPGDPNAWKPVQQQQQQAPQGYSLGERLPQVPPPQQGLTPNERAATSQIIGLANGAGLGRYLQGSAREKYDTTYAEKTGEAAASKDILAAAMPQLTNLLEKFKDDSYRVGKGVLSKSIGPNYDNKTGYLGSIVQGAQGMANGDAAAATGMNTGSPAYTALMKTRYGSGDPEKPNEYDLAADHNAGMHHLVEAAANIFKGLPDIAGKGATTDATMATLKQMVDAAVHAPSPEAHFKIINDAIGALKNQAGFAPSKPVDVHTPPGFGPPMSVGIAQRIMQQGHVPKVSPQDAARLPSGTVFDTLDGRRILKN